MVPEALRASGTQGWTSQKVPDNGVFAGCQGPFAGHPAIRAHHRNRIVKRIVVPIEHRSDWQRLLAKPKLHWKRGASAMTAAASWEAAAGALPPEITVALNSAKDASLTDLKLLLARPEWEVPLEGGETTSNTDVLAICRNDEGLCMMAVEAKVHEDFGPLVGQKRAEASAGQSARLTYLEELLNVARFDDRIRYQLVHRTASALLTAREFHAGSAVMMVQAWDAPPARRSDFEAFCLALSGEQLAPLVCQAPGFQSPKLFLAWCNGDPRFLNVELPSAL